MSQIIVDDDLRAKLDGRHSAEFCEADGKRLGYFFSEEEYAKMVIAIVKAELKDEELDRVRAETGGCSLADIWQRLGVRP